MILGVVGALSIVPCMIMVLRKHSAVRSAHQYEGRVVEHELRESTGKKGRRRTTYTLKISYQDEEGTRHEFSTRTASNPPSREIGDTVTVFHHPDGSDPDILVFTELYLGYWLWFCFGICCAGCVLGPRVIEWVYRH